MGHKVGKKPARYDSRDLLYSEIRASVTLPPIPKPHGGYGSDFSDWGMAGNGPVDPGDHSLPADWTAAQNGAGDCTVAGSAHEEKESAYNAKRPALHFAAKNCLQQYATLTKLENGVAYDPISGANDTGLEVRTVLGYRQKTGLLDDAGGVHKIGTYVALEPGNLTDLWEALWLFEAVGIGIQFPESAMNQFDDGQSWSVVAGAQIDGGHYIPLVGHPSTNVWTCVTWGRRQTMTPAFLTKYCDEAYAWIDAERYAAVTGKTLEGYADADLEAYIAGVGQTFPAAA